MRDLGGELGRARPDNGALASLDADYMLYTVGMTPVPELVAPVQEQVRAIKDALKPWAARQMYLNLADDRSSAAPFWTEQAYGRLQQIKTRVDPHDLIRANHPVPAAAA